jgi:hypothetical protein
MLMRNPGPVNSHSFLHEKGGIPEAAVEVASPDSSSSSSVLVPSMDVTLTFLSFPRTAAPLLLAAAPASDKFDIDRDLWR